MYAKYVSVAAPVLADIVSDLALLSSGSPISALSASCDKVNSQILVNTDPVGWTLSDAAGPNSSKVLTAKDLSNADKFVYIAPKSTTGLFIGAFDTYNPATHTGTNQTAPAPTSNLAFTAGIVNTFNLLVNARHLIITNADGTVMCADLEFTRDASYLSNLSYPAHGVLFDQGDYQQVQNFMYPRVKNMVAAGDQVSARGAFVGLCSTYHGADYSLMLPTAPMRDSTDAVYHPMTPAYLGLKQGNTDKQFTLGRIVDGFFSTSNYGSVLDTIFDGVDNFLLLLPFTGGGGGAPHRLAIKIA